MAKISAPDPRRVTAEHNVRAILDGAERLLRRGEEPSISAVAHEAGVSRPTVYAHFPDRGRLLEALVERTVRETMAAIGSSEPERGPAADVLTRLIPSAWQQIAKHDEIAHAAARELSGEAMRAAHQSARDAIGKLVERGRGDGSFRRDIPTNWLVTASLALIHATAEEVRIGQLDPDTGLQTLMLTITELFAKR
jgi:AcrR family transcriptional regulator